MPNDYDKPKPFPPRSNDDIEDFEVGSIRLVDRGRTRIAGIGPALSSMGMECLVFATTANGFNQDLAAQLISRDMERTLAHCWSATPAMFAPLPWVSFV